MPAAAGSFYICDAEINRKDIEFKNIMFGEELKDDQKKHSVKYEKDYQKEIEFLFGDKIGTVFNFGKELLFDTVSENIPEIISVLKNNPELEFDTLSYIKYKESARVFLAGLLSYSNGITVNIRLKTSHERGKAELHAIMEELKKHYKNTEYYTDRHYLKDTNRDAVILAQTPETLDCFDIYLSLDDNIIKKAYFSRDISSVSQEMLYKVSEINKIIARINITGYKSAVFPELCFCMGIEKLLSLKIPKRAVYIRMLLSELFRISAHLSSVTNMSLVLGNNNMLNYVLTEREKILGIIEQITGSRIIPNFIRIGGVKKDINENILRMILKSLPSFFKNLRRIEEGISSDIILLEKLKDIGTLGLKDAKEYGLSGPNLRASGVRFDMRKDPGYLLYRDFSFTIPLGRYGDNLDRLIIRFKEIYQSLKIINEIIKSMPVGPVESMREFSIADIMETPVISAVEYPDGIYKLLIEVRPDSGIEIVPIGPMVNNANACEMVLEGCNFDNLLATVSSFSIGSPEMY